MGVFPALAGVILLCFAWLVLCLEGLSRICGVYAVHESVRHFLYQKKGQKMRIIKDSHAVFERCYKAQEALEEARKAIQAQVETEKLEYQEPIKDGE